MEIYHNIAAKNSDSDEGQLNKPKNPTKICEEVQVEMDEIPPLKIAEELNQYINYQRDRCDKTTQNIDAYDPPEAPRTISCYSKNYELPTIASKMKQAAKYYLNTFNFKVSIDVKKKNHLHIDLVW